MRAIRTIATLLVILGTLTACQTGTSGRTAGRTADDAKITTAVKSKLVADRTASLTQVNVDTENGIVRLNGSVDTAEQKARAEQLAREATGVRQVVNNLQVHRR